MVSGRFLDTDRCNYIAETELLPNGTIFPFRRFLGLGVLCEQYASIYNFWPPSLPSNDIL